MKPVPNFLCDVKQYCAKLFVRFSGQKATIVESKLPLNCHLILGLWKVLSDNGLSHKVLISVLYSFIDSGDKVSEN